jgi:hypothetical protein
MIWPSSEHVIKTRKVRELMKFLGFPCLNNDGDAWTPIIRAEDLYDKLDGEENIKEFVETIRKLKLKAFW